MVYTTTRDIAAGEEVFKQYGPSWWITQWIIQKMIENDFQWLKIYAEYLLQDVILEDIFKKMSYGLEEAWRCWCQLEEIARVEEEMRKSNGIHPPALKTKAGTNSKRNKLKREKKKKKSLLAKPL